MRLIQWRYLIKFSCEDVDNVIDNYDKFLEVTGGLGYWHVVTRSGH